MLSQGRHVLLQMCVGGVLEPQGKHSSHTKWHFNKIKVQTLRTDPWIEKRKKYVPAFAIPSSFLLLPHTSLLLIGGGFFHWLLTADFPCASVQVRKLQLTEEGGSDSDDSLVWCKQEKRQGGGKHLRLKRRRRVAQAGLMKARYAEAKEGRDPWRGRTGSLWVHQNGAREPSCSHEPNGLFCVSGYPLQNKRNA